MIRIDLFLAISSLGLMTDTPSYFPVICLTVQPF